MENIIDKIFSHRNIGIVIHTHPDADAVGSALALSRVLESQGIVNSIYCVDEVPAELRFLEGVENIRPKIRNGHDAIVALDIGGIEKAGFRTELENFPGPVYSIDHHIQTNEFADHSFVNTKASSTCQILFKLFKEKDFEVDRHMATCLAAGIAYDTQCLQHATTTPETFEIVAELMKLGARMPKVCRAMGEKKTFKALKFWGKVIDRLKFDDEAKIVSTAVKPEDVKDLDDSQADPQGLNSILNSIRESSVSLILAEEKGRVVRGSFRTEDFKEKRVDVAKVAEQFGGGGHKNAAGFSTRGRVVERENGWDVE